jgi:integrating conjugative element protein (TIGR03757 family)
VSLAIAVTLSVGGVASTAFAEREPVRVEVFTVQDLAVRPLEPGDLSASTTIEVYKVDETERFETILSEHLPPDPEVAKRLAQERLRQLRGSQIEAAKRAALGLVKAAEYGIERYPAIVFDGEAVVYGVTDIGEALRLYRERQGTVPR